MDGIILVDKPVGITSYDVVKLIKRHFKSKKVGHCGTLDPFASGLLIIGLNKATKIMSYLEHDFKEYIATIKLGSSTDSYDLTGNVVSTSNINKVDEKQINDVLSSFKGVIKQVPPIYSSIHIDGKHLYEYARNNEQVEIPEREVTIYDIKLLSFNDDSISIYVKCSRGTYIRSLGVDIAKVLNNDGHLSYLRRISIGNNLIDNANSYQDFLDGNIKLISINDALSFKKLFIEDNKILKRVYNGQDIILKNETDDVIIINDDEGEVAIYKKIDNSIYHCERGLFDEDYRFRKLCKLH